jgi:hypothetical protein
MQRQEATHGRLRLTMYKQTNGSNILHISFCSGSSVVATLLPSSTHRSVAASPQYLIPTETSSPLFS